ncbi:hypothetical protein SAMN05446635_3273 [Burkholderia sp. OK233]|nr:hypothetical protein SAMN05446635_3273 [Burkholderia sp. OK233]
MFFIGMDTLSIEQDSILDGGRCGVLEPESAEVELPLANAMHQFDAAQKDPRTAKSFESQHGSRTSLDRPMVLLDEVVEIFGLADLDGRFTIMIDGFECSEIGAAFVDSHGLGHAILGYRFLKVTPGCSLVPMGAQQKVNGVAVLVDGPVKIPPFALDAEWSKRQGVVELSPCLSSPNRTCTSQRIRLSVEVLLIAKATSA